MHTLATVVQEFSACTQKDFMQRVALFCDQLDAGHPGHGLPADFTWAFLPAFVLSQLAGVAREWIRWSAEEKSIWIEDYGACQSEQIEAYWLPRPWLHPVIVVEGTDGGFYAWDGNHRIGAAFSAGARTVPAIVGLRKIRGIARRTRSAGSNRQDGG
jgi:hypothetical protein